MEIACLHYIQLGWGSVSGSIYIFDEQVPVREELYALQQR